mgnify:CR=1 FL=1
MWVLCQICPVVCLTWNAPKELDILFVVWLCFKAHPRIFHLYMMTLQLSVKGCKILAYVWHLEKYERYQSQDIKSQNWISEHSAHPEVQQARYNLLCCMDPIAGFIQKQLLTENSRELLIKEVYQLIST